MPRPRILLVDDEPNILESLKLALRKQRDVWDLRFACGGEEALALLEAAGADVIVCDMKMPGMDGAEFLARARERWPAAARLVLSGHAEQEAVLRAMSVAHQFLAKPLQPEALKAVVARAVALQELLGRAELKELVGRIGELPALPTTYARLAAAARDPRTGFRDLAAVVEADPLVSAKILQLVNSAYFGLAREVGSVEGAVRLLGPQVLLGMSLAASTLGEVARRLERPGLLDEFQEHAIAASGWARRLLEGADFRDEAVTAALIHDLGAILLVLADPAAYADLEAKVRDRHLERHLLETEVFGVSHAEIGAYLLGLWGLPLPTVEAVAYHHRRGEAPEGDVRLLAAVHAADVLSTAEGAAAAAQVDRELLRRAGLEAAFDALAPGVAS